MAFKKASETLKVNENGGRMTIISHTKIVIYLELFFLHRTEVGCETSTTMATEGSAEINGFNLSIFWGRCSLDEVK